MDNEAASTIRKHLGLLDPGLIDEIISTAQVVELEAGHEILREGQYVKVVPIVLEGLVKVYTRFEDRELLLYYIEPNESCVMSFSAALENAPSEVFALTEAPTKALLLSSDELQGWTKTYPGLNRLFFTLFNARYSELIDTINHLLYQKMDTRLISFLRERSRVKNQNPIKISHRQIAQELGTAREVVTRIMKRLETDDLVQQVEEGIRIL